MKNIKYYQAFVLICYSIFAMANNHKDLTKDFIEGAPPILSMSTLAFGPEGILFIGDSKSAKIFAIDLQDRVTPDSLDGLEIKNIEQELAARIGRSVSEIMIHHMAVNPISKNIYLAISAGPNRKLWNNRFHVPNDYDDAQVLVRVLPDRTIEHVNLENVKYASTELLSVPEEDSKFFRTPGINYTITDLEYEDGKLFASGLGNADFKSLFRTIDFPFKERAIDTPIETFHIVHNRYETYAPALTFVPTTINKEPMILAIYYCTPLVLLPRDSLNSSNRLRGRSIAELGSGSRVTEMIKYTFDGEELFLIAGNNKSFIKIRKADIEKFEGEFLEIPEGETPILDDGTPYKVTEMIAQQLDNYTDELIVILTRRPNGTLDLTTVPKGWL